MNFLPQTTKNRLQRLPQNSNIWEGDRMPLVEIIDHIDSEIAEESDCIIWLDSSEGEVRSMDIVRSIMGKEAMIRALLKAMENPQNSLQPYRPQKIMVKDRELQFLLRGVLQDLNITVMYQTDLPFMD
jgi:hypothetical protein